MIRNLVIVASISTGAAILAMLLIGVPIPSAWSALSAVLLLTGGAARALEGAPDEG